MRPRRKLATELRESFDWFARGSLVALLVFSVVYLTPGFAERLDDWLQSNHAPTVVRFSTSSDRPQVVAERHAPGPNEKRRIHIKAQELLDGLLAKLDNPCPGSGSTLVAAYLGLERALERTPDNLVPAMMRAQKVLRDNEGCPN